MAEIRRVLRFFLAHKLIASTFSGKFRSIFRKKIRSSKKLWCNFALQTRCPKNLSRILADDSLILAEIRRFEPRFCVQAGESFDKIKVTERTCNLHFPARTCNDLELKKGSFQSGPFPYKSL